MTIADFAASSSQRDKLQSVSVPAGEFVMGSAWEQALEFFHCAQGALPFSWFERETPERMAYLDAFEIAKYPVTCAQYAQFCEDSGHSPPWYWKSAQPPEEIADHPVVCVSYKDAQAFCRWAGGRLPYEAEWEKAARGTIGWTYPWGNEADPKRCRTCDGGSHEHETESVGARPLGESAYRAADMAGNVMEWTCDRLVAYPGFAPAALPEWVCAMNREEAVLDYAGRPLACASASSFAEAGAPGHDRNSRFCPDRIVVRGGSFASAEALCRCAARTAVPANSKLQDLGFRCVFAPDPHLQAKELLGKGETSAALAAFQKALQLSPNHPEILADAAQANQLNGNSLYALELWQNLLNVHPEHRQASQEIQRFANVPRPARRELDGAAGASSLRIPTALIFGPRYLEVTKALGAELTSKGLTVLYACSAKELGFCAEKLAPCTLIFCHYVPDHQNRQTSREEFHMWKHRLMDSLDVPPDQFGAMRLRWICDPTNGDAILFLHWQEIKSLHCQKAAQALEKAFMRWGGSLHPVTPARP